MTILNPYQKGAVKSKDQFFGYNKQRKEMEECIDQSRGASNKHMIFMGEPSTGKTSFLNLTDEYCNENQLFTTLVDIKIETSCYDFFKDVIMTKC